MFGFHQVGVPEEENWLGRLASFLPGADAMSSKDRMALVSQGLLAMGAGILKNNYGHRGKAGPAIGAGITEGLLAMNRGAEDMSERKQREAYLLAQGGDPAQFRAMDLAARAAGYEPGTEGYKAYFRRANGELPRASSAAYGYQIVEGPDGRPQLVVTDPRNPSASPLGADGGPMLQGPGYSIDPSLPPEVQAAIRQAEAAGQPLPPHIDLAPAVPRQSPTARVNPFRGRRPEDEAAAIAAAQKAVELGALPTELGMRTNAAIEQARGTAMAGADVERDTQTRQKMQALAQYEAARTGLVTGLAGTETGPVAGRLPAVTEGQQIAEGGVAAMAPVLKQLFRSAGEGVFTDRDQALLMEMLPTRTDHPTAAAAKIRNIDAIIRAKLGSAGDAAGAAGAGSGLRRGSVEDGYRFLGGDPADPRNWERL